VSDDVGRPDPRGARSDQPDAAANDGRSGEGPPLGSVVAAAREAREMSVEDVAAATRIRVGLIRAIERDDFSGCGGTFYARGHLRTIARVVGADEQAVLTAFDERSDETPDAAAVSIDASGVSPEPPAAPPRRFTPRFPARFTPRWAAAAAAVIVVLAAVVVGGWLMTRSGPNSASHGAAGGTASHTPAPHPSHHPTARPTHTKPPAPPPSGVALKVQITGDRSWLQVTSSDGTSVYEGVLDSGAQMKFSDPDKLTVRFGNPPAVSVTVNGKQVGRPCTQSVCTVEFSNSSNQAG
jgi:cytoskeleton protein RodZ